MKENNNPLVDKKIREIKFRAWDSKINEFHYWNSLMQQYDNAFWVIVKNEKLTPNQFCGLYDKNNNPIYEGDIVKIVNQIIAEIFTDLYEGVKIRHHKESVRTKIIGSMIEPIARNHHFTHEVIGNIYENPEYLNQKQ